MKRMTGDAAVDGETFRREADDLTDRLRGMVREHAAEVAKNDPQQEWLRQRQWYDIKVLAVQVAVMKVLRDCFRE